MLNRLGTLIAIFVCATMAMAQTPAAIQPMQPTYSLSVATATGAGTAFQQKLNYPGAQPGNKVSWEVIATGSPSAVTVNLEGSIDLQTSSVGSATASSTTFTCATCNFNAADAGKEITIVGAGSAGATLVTTISVVTNATTVTLGAAASTTVSNATTRWAFWYTLDVCTTTTHEARFVTYKGAFWIRANLATLTGGSSPTVTALLMTGGQ